MMFGTKDKFDYLECAACGTVQIVKIPDLSLYYPEDYYSFDAFANPNLRMRLGLILARAYHAWKKSSLSRRGARIVPFIATRLDRLDLESGLIDMGLGLSSVLRLDLRPTSRILDVGCGEGKLLSVLSDLGFRSLTGADAFINGDRSYPNGVKIFKRDLENIEGEYDVIMFHHSFEHLPDPGRALRAVREKLAEGGVCLIRIPIVSYAWEKYGVNWVGLDPPRHLHLFSEKSFRSLTEREGLMVEKAVYDSTSFQFSGSEQYLQNIPLMAKRPENSIFTKQQMRQWAREARRLNAAGRGDQAVFYLISK